jgi:hypothetical protein
MDHPEEDLKLDARSQKCVLYTRIKDLEQSLAKELKGLRKDGTI